MCAFVCLLLFVVLACTRYSWEIGTELETLTELEWPQLSVFYGTVPPPAQLPTPDTAADVISKATAYAIFIFCALVHMNLTSYI